MSDTQLTFGSLFAGIGGFDLGLQRAGLACAWQVEIDRDCNRVLDRHWPGRRAYSDVCDFKAAKRIIRPDVICGGFPCQDLSVAGKRAGLAGERSGLWFQFKRIVSEFSPRWVLIENVPGLLSSDGGRDFGTILGGLAELVYGFAYRVLDSQWFGVPQRRRRVFIVGCLGDWRRAATVLFECDSVPWDSAPSREERTRVAPGVRAGIDGSGNAGGFQIQSANQTGDRKQNGIGIEKSDVMYTLTDRDQHAVAVSFAENQRGEIRTSDIAPQLSCGGGKPGSGYSAVAMFNASDYANGCFEESDLARPITGTPDRSRAAPIVTMPIPIDMRQASRGEKMTNNRTDGGPPGTGIGEPGDPSPTIAHSHTPAVAFQQDVLSDREAEEIERGLKERGLTMDTVIAAFEGTGHPAPDKCYAFQTRIARNGRGQPKEITDALTSAHGGTHADSKPHVTTRMGIRRLTPRECERLQGFPDDWTRSDADGNELSDSPRYRMLGNAVTPPVTEWIAGRILKQS